MLLELVVFVVLGIVIGAVGSITVVGVPRDATRHWIATGVSGALFGGFLGLVAGARAPDPTTGAVLASFVGAIVFLALRRARACGTLRRARSV
jgi:uncharacterized membrane protein YeaQ/YmgE (transglycosylase-associated protein family)